MNLKLYTIELRSSKLPTAVSKTWQLNKHKIITWGENNLYPFFLNFLYANSAIHKGFVNGKVEYYKTKLAPISEELDKNGTQAYTITEINDRLLLDFELKNAFAIRVKINEITKRREFDYVDIDNVRIDESGDYFYMSNEWHKGRRAAIKEILPNYFEYPNEMESLAVYYGEVKQMYDVNEEQFVYNYYPLPTYSGAIDSIMTDIEISHFNLSEIINGFSGGTIISLNNGRAETEQEEQRIINELRENIKNRDKKGGVIVLFSDGNGTEPTINSINGNNIVDRYNTLTEDIIQRILIAHNITSPLLVGVKTSGQLGGATELEIAKDTFEENYVKPRINTFVNFVNQVYKIDIQLQFNEHVHFDEHSDLILSEFDIIGRSKNDLILAEDIQEFDLPEDELINKFQSFDLKLTKLQDELLNLITTGNSLDEIAKAKNMDIVELTKIYNTLKNLGLITDNNRLTSKGKAVASQAEVIQIYYEYRVRPGLGEPIIPTTRYFCQELIKKNKVYTREEINMISDRVGRDVWYYRGGHFHDKRDGKTYPFCRHYWYQVIGIEKK